MLDRILDERLKNEMRNERGASARRDANGHRQPVLVTHPHDVEVALEKRQLFGKWDLMRPRRLERRAQEIRQLHDHAVRRCRIAVYERRDAVESIEKKVRPELTPQYFQLRFRQSNAQFGGKLLAFLPAPVEEDTVDDGDDSPKDHRLDDEVRRERAGERRVRVSAHEPPNLHEEGVLDHHRDAAGDELYEEVGAPMSPVDGKVRCRPEEQRCEYSARVPIEHACGEQPPSQMLTGLAEVESSLRAREESQRRPDAEDGDGGECS